MSFMENDLVLFGKRDEEIDWRPFATANIGSIDEQLTRKSAADPYLTLYLVQDYTYINGHITTTPENNYVYIELLGSLGGLWSGLTCAGVIIVALYTKSHLMLFIVDKLYLTRRI